MEGKERGMRVFGDGGEEWKGVWRWLGDEWG